MTAQDQEGALSQEKARQQQQREQRETEPANDYKTNSILIMVRHKQKCTIKTPRKRSLDWLMFKDVCASVWKEESQHERGEKAGVGVREGEDSQKKSGREKKRDRGNE